MVKSRSKRSWVFPGTLWCGAGSKAVRYDQLGFFMGADRCCREHDHCQHTIAGLTAKYGFFNRKLYTISHCDCDQRFRECLHAANDTISNLVGSSFFNVLKVPCFELKQQNQCTLSTDGFRRLQEQKKVLLLSHKKFWLQLCQSLFSRCSRAFTKASDLLQALKKVEEKDTARVRKSGNERKRGFPVRLYKRCLRLEKEAGNMEKPK
uniref:phospholipase A2 n=1 Tax=Mola mola TaxID=94237 RepID=A0A3Q3WTM9_MOLML